MDKETRTRIQRATQAARALLEHEYAEQLGGIFDIRLDESIAVEPGTHLDAEQRMLRTKLVAAVDHRRASGLKASDAVASYLREAAFTMLNRFVALKMLEARGLVQECVSRGDQSVGFKEFIGLAPGLVQVPDHGYRLYIESLFDEIGREVRVLFDRHDPAGLLWPRRQTLSGLLTLINAADLAEVWKEDETIGWVYQYFNSKEEREAMRDPSRGGSQAPRNSRELAVRNQFFTPRYVVGFLTDNTLGRIWYEMRQGKTRLVNECNHLVRRPGEIFLAEGQNAPEDETRIEGNLTQEELLKKTVYVRFRAKKDPRDLKILDPACGSGHFLLYAFGLLLTIYEEGWNDEATPASEATGRRLREDYASLDDLRREMPGLVLRHNLYGIDIDPRATQIAALALWMRSQRAYNEFGIGRDARLLITRTSIVIAEPMPGEMELRKEFIASLDKNLRQLVERVFEKMKLAGEAGSLLKIEDDIQLAIREVYRETGSLFRESDEAQWRDAERELLLALSTYAERAQGGLGYQRQLFAEDTAHGFAFIDLCRQRYDAVLMNPPFGEPSEQSTAYVESRFTNAKSDIGMAFINAAVSRLNDCGYVGVLSTRACFANEKLTKWRSAYLFGGVATIDSVADLGIGVLDAWVEVAAFSIRNRPATASDCCSAYRMLDVEDKERELREAIGDSRRVALRRIHEFGKVPSAVFCYWLPGRLLRLFDEKYALNAKGSVAYQGLATGDDFRFFRLFWEVPEGGIRTGARSPTGRWVPLAKGGEYNPLYDEIHLLMDWENDGAACKAYVVQQYPYLNGDWGWVVKNSEHYFRRGLTYPERTVSDFSPRVMPDGIMFSAAGQAVLFPDDDEAVKYMFGAYTRVYKALTDAFLGSGDTTAGGSAAKHIRSGLLNQLPHALPTASSTIVDEALSFVRWRREVASSDETSRFFQGPATGVHKHAAGLRSATREIVSSYLKRSIELIEFNLRVEEIQRDSFRLEDEDWEATCGLVGPHAAQYCARPEKIDLACRLAVLSDDELVENCKRLLGARRQITKKAYIADRRLELICHALQSHPRGFALEPRFVAAFAERKESAEARTWLSVLVGVVVGRFRIDSCVGERTQDEGDVFAELPVIGPAQVPIARLRDHIALIKEKSIALPESGACVDDEGDPYDIVGLVEQVAGLVFGRSAVEWMHSILESASGPTSRGSGLRTYLRREFFANHLRGYSRSRRKAPVYWQLATASGSYSVWLYYQRLTADSLYKVLYDNVAAKLGHEERKLLVLVQGAGETPVSSQRKEIAGQDAFVRELRDFRDEVARIAPLWNPDLNDGVIINFAPLWRLIPQHRTWQKECKNLWDGLVAGHYDWARLAMRLWPERVVPECAEDRSLAVAHGLDGIFWVEDREGKWHKRKVDQPTIRRLVAERTSGAVKDALRNLLEAPAPGTGRGSTRTRAAARPAAPDRRRKRQGAASEPGGPKESDALERVCGAIAGRADGASKAEVLAATGITDVQWNEAIRSLLSQGLATKTGDRRGARYHIVGTEDQS